MQTRHLTKTEIIAGRVTKINHEHKTITVRPAAGEEYPLPDDIIVVTAGAVTRTLAVPGVAEHAIGMKHVEEAVAIRDRLLTALRFHLVETRHRLLPEVTDQPGDWVVRSSTKRGARVHLDTRLLSAAAGHVVLSTGEEFDSELIVWTVGNAANPMVHNHTDLPIDGNGMPVVRSDLRVGPYVHHSLGGVASLGFGRGVFQFHRLVVKGFAAWLTHRGYQVLAVPTWERKVRVLAVWATAVPFGRDIVSLTSVQHPRAAFLVGTRPAADALRS